MRVNVLIFKRTCTAAIYKRVHVFFQKTIVRNLEMQKVGVRKKNCRIKEYQISITAENNSVRWMIFFWTYLLCRAIFEPNYLKLFV